MPRPISWIPRLHEIRRAVAKSVRSHYDRRDIEQLFQLQPRAAQKLLESLPSVAVGTSRLVDRDTLASFLDQLHKADDVAAVLQQYRSTKTPAPRRRLLSLVQRDDTPVSLDALPPGLQLERGRLEIRFRSTEELAQAMYFLARALDADPERFAAEFEPASLVPAQGHDLTGLFSELQSLERQDPDDATPPLTAPTQPG